MVKRRELILILDDLFTAGNNAGVEPKNQPAQRGRDYNVKQVKPTHSTSQIVEKRKDILSPLLKFFGKGSLRGRTFFSKKVFPSQFKLEKTSTIGSQLTGDRKFFQEREIARQGIIILQRISDRR